MILTVVAEKVARLRIERAVAALAIDVPLGSPGREPIGPDHRGGLIVDARRGLVIVAWRVIVRAAGRPAENGAYPEADRGPPCEKPQGGLMSRHPVCPRSADRM